MNKELRLLAGLCLVSFSHLWALDNSQIGKEVSIPVHLKDGEELQMPISDLAAFGSQLFQARWTTQEGQGRPLTKGTANPLSDPSSPLAFPRNFDRLSGPDSNSCSGCHNTPFPGGGGDRVSEVFVLGQRFDFLDFDPIPRPPGESPMSAASSPQWRPLSTRGRPSA